MRKLILLALCITIGVLSASAEVRFGGGAHAGLSFSSFPSQVSEFYGMGFGGGLHGDLRIIEPLALRLNVDYNRFGSDKTKLEGQFSVTDPLGNPVPFEVDGLDVTAFSITANAIGMIPTGSAVRPYGIVGLGLHFLSTSNLKITASGQTLLDQSSEGSTEFGLNFGAGTEFLLGSTRLFVEAKYVLILTEGSSTAHIPVTVGVSF
jgi:opacity protein-like surface antigen